MRTNAGYEIIAAEAYWTYQNGKKSEVVLGKMRTAHGDQFVTWECTVTPAAADYYWGHYFDNRMDAFADYHKRLLEKYDLTKN